MTGGGFGGCAVALTREEALAATQARIQDAFQRRFGKSPGFLVTRAAAGAREL